MPRKVCINLPRVHSSARDKCVTDKLQVELLLVRQETIDRNVQLVELLGFKEAHSCYQGVRCATTPTIL